MSIVVHVIPVINFQLHFGRLGIFLHTCTYANSHTHAHTSHISFSGAGSVPNVDRVSHDRLLKEKLLDKM